MNPDHLKIAFVLDAFPVLSQTFILNQITGFLDLGHQVDIYAYSKPGLSEAHADIESYHLLRRAFYPQTHTIKGMQSIHLIFCILFNLHKNPNAMFSALKAYLSYKDSLRLRMLPLCLRRFQEYAYDIIQCHFGPNGNLAVLVKKLGGIKSKVVTMFHGYDIRLTSKYGGRIYRPLKDHGDCFLSISKYNRTQLEKLSFDPQKIIDHPVGIDLDKFPFPVEKKPYPINGGPVVILTVARLIEEKGLEYGIRCIRELVNRMPDLNVRYMIIGEGILRESLEGLVAELGLVDVVRFTGEKAQTDVSLEMQKAHIFLLPSVSEALPVVLMEAHATGLPVLASDVGSVDEIVVDGESGFLVPKQNVTALTDKLEYLIRHPEMTLQMGSHGRKHVKSRFDINKLNQRLVEIYHSLMT